MGDVVWDGMELTLRFLLALRWKDLVADAYFDIIGFTCKDQQGLILSLPAEECDRSIVAVSIFRSFGVEGWTKLTRARGI
jgi:hypothetical protein